MTRDEQIKAISAPSWETELRAKARDVLAGLDQMGVNASPVTFAVQGITVHMARNSTSEVAIEIADGLYALRLPVAWLTGKTR
jgi:hypothetical protein